MLNETSKCYSSLNEEHLPKFVSLMVYPQVGYIGYEPCPLETLHQVN